MQRVHAGVLCLVLGRELRIAGDGRRLRGGGQEALRTSAGGDAVPLLDKVGEVVVDVLLKLADALRGEGVADNLALPGVRGAVADVEEAAVDADKGVVELALGEAVAVPVDNADGAVVRDRDMVGLDAHERAVPGVCSVHGLRASCETGLVEKPEVREGGEARPGDLEEGGAAEVGEEVEEDGQQEDGPRGEEEGEEHVCRTTGVRAGRVVVDVFSLTFASSAEQADHGVLGRR